MLIPCVSLIPLSVCLSVFPLYNHRALVYRGKLNIHSCVVNHVDVCAP
jgi:hypothetical protein